MSLRIVIGAAVCGSFLGIFAGALIGFIYGGFVDNVSHGLDGALLGGCLGGVGGILFGAGLALRESGPRTGQPSVPNEASEQRRQSSIPAVVHGPEWSNTPETRHLGMQ